MTDEYMNDVRVFSVIVRKVDCWRIQIPAVTADMAIEEAEHRFHAPGTDRAFRFLRCEALGFEIEQPVVGDTDAEVQS